MSEEGGKLKTRWSVSAYDKKDQEWTTAWNESYDMQPEQNEWQAERAKITPSRKKGKDRNYETIAVMGDAHIGYRNINGEIVPTHDERALQLARYCISEMQPEKIISIGDMVDFAELSRFRPDSDHYIGTLGRSIQRVHDFYAELRADNPKAQIIEVGSNHAQRVKKSLLDDLPQMYNVKRAKSESKYPVMSYPYMANLEHIGVDFYSGENAEYNYEDMVFTHNAGKGVNKMLLNYPDTNTFSGHWHNAEMHQYTNRHGKVLGNYVCGVLCRLDGIVPSAHSEVNDVNEPVKRYEKWSQGIIEAHKAEGLLEVRHIAFEEGNTLYNGKCYNTD